jgi:SprT protein
MRGDGVCLFEVEVWRILRSAIDCRVATKVEVERLCAKHGIVVPRVSFGLRSRCAGISYTGLNWVDFNLVMFRENFFDFLANVIPHELCHAWFDQLGLKGWPPHGKGWQDLMKRCGIKAEKYHNYCTEGAVSRTGLFRYRCVCSGVGHLVSLEMHRRVQERPDLFNCGVCRVGFVYVAQPVYSRRRRA